MAPPEFHHFASPSAQWQHMPSFVVGELLFIVGALAALWHASRRGRAHQLIWLAALVAGTANDLIFMALPLVDNFWQAQALVMLTPRMPLYIPCVYVSFMYWPVVTVLRLGLPRLASAALSGLVAVLFYVPYDMVGAKFLWWTWHDTDQTIAARVLGAPCSSTLWVLTFTGAFAWLVQWRSAEISAVEFLKSLAKVAGLTTLAMMLQMTVLQQLDGGTPRYFALAAGFALYAALAARGFRSPQLRSVAPVVPADRIARNMLLTHCLVLMMIGLVFRPETQLSTGIHQPLGRCHVEATDITGLKRYAFLCANDFDEDYDFACTAQPAPNAAVTWYTICGRPHAHALRWKAVLVFLALSAALVFTRAWSRRSQV